jgi:hypothetical protein
MAGPEDQLGRDPPLADHALAVIDVVQEEVEGAHALLEAAGQPLPFGAGDDARHQVEREHALEALVPAVHGERDALVQERRVGLAPPLVELPHREPREVLGQRAVVGPHLPRPREHLVVEAPGGVGAVQDGMARGVHEAGPQQGTCRGGIRITLAAQQLERTAREAGPTETSKGLRFPTEP